VITSVTEKIGLFWVLTGAPAAAYTERPRAGNDRDRDPRYDRKIDERCGEPAAIDVITAASRFPSYADVDDSRDPAAMIALNLDFIARTERGEIGGVRNRDVLYRHRRRADSMDGSMGDGNAGRGKIDLSNNHPHPWRSCRGRLGWPQFIDAFHPRRVSRAPGHIASAMTSFLLLGETGKGRRRHGRASQRH
jgi:hypothetical protein